MVRQFTALYVHVPFCAAKCGYCAFYSVAGASPELRQRYLERLERELAAHEAECAAMDSAYVGGGTPSFLSAGELDALLGALREHVELREGAEFTVECNPDSLTSDKVDVLVARGVNRVSLGVQSFCERLRETIGRGGSLDGLQTVLDALKRGGTANIGMDLIYAIPGQTLQDWRSDLRRACAAGIRHLSTYELTVEEGARLARCQRGGLARRRSGDLSQGKARPVGEELAAAMWRAAAEVAAEHGLARYEVSNLAQPGCECRHNDAVWHGGTYLGVGPAASSFDGDVRRTNPRDLAAWLNGAAPEEDRLPPEARAAEILAFGLRTVRGWTQQEFLDRTGFDYVGLRGRILAELSAEGLLDLTPEAVRPTDRGLLFADHVARRLLS